MWHQRYKTPFVSKQFNYAIQLHSNECLEANLRKVQDTELTKNKEHFQARVWNRLSHFSPTSPTTAQSMRTSALNSDHSYTQWTRTSFEGIRRSYQNAAYKFRFRLNLWSTMVTICKTCFNIQYRCTLCKKAHLLVMHYSQNKQRLFP